MPDDAALFGKEREWNRSTTPQQTHRLRNPRALKVDLDHIRPESRRCK
jgi:hypothetical protein